MGYLIGFKEYLDECYNLSVFDEAFASKELWELHIHNHRVVKAEVVENSTYDIRISSGQTGEILLPKTDVKLLYRETLSESIRPMLKTDKNVERLSLEPILAPGKRYHIKNKSLFPLMKERRVVFFTLLEGEIVRGIIAGFSRYEIAVTLKGGIPVTILRHSIYDLRDKKGRCFLKSFQDKTRDWEKDKLFVSSTPET
jgi:hypothetical protein